MLELAEMINELVGNAGGVEIGPPRDWDRSGQRYGTTGKSERELGFLTKVELREGLERTIEWTRDNLDWIERCMSRHADRVPGLQLSGSASV